MHAGKWIEVVDDARVDSLCPGFLRIEEALERSEKACKDMLTKTSILM